VAASLRLRSEPALSLSNGTSLELATEYFLQPFKIFVKVFSMSCTSKVHLHPSTEEYRHQDTCGGDKQRRAQHLQYDTRQRGLEVAGRKRQAQVDRRDEKPADKAREGERFETYFCLRPGADERD